MSQPESPKLSLGDPPGRLKRQLSHTPRGWLILLAAMQAAAIGCLVALLLRGQGAGPGGAASTAGAEELRRAALELQNKSLDGQAALAWEEYLKASPDSKERAEILFQIGKLHMQAEEFDRAAAAFVRSEQAAGGDALRRNIAPHLMTCLRRLGLYGEVGRELSRQVEVGAEKQERSQVLATLDGEPITDSDLDRMIERRVDQMLSMQEAAGNESARQSLLEQLSRPEMRQRLLEELLQTELMVRRARDLKMDQEAEYLDARRYLEEDLLAQRFQQRELGKIEPTDVDLEAFLNLHKDQYRVPESLKAVVLQLKDGEDATPLLAKIQSPQDFQKIAGERLGGAKELPRQTVVRGREHPELGDAAPLFQLKEGQWTRQPHVAGQNRFLVLVESKSPGAAPSLADVRPQVEADYRVRKRQELSQKLLRELMTRYDVKITAPQKTPEEEKGKGGSPPQKPGQPPPP